MTRAWKIVAVPDDGRYLKSKFADVLSIWTGMSGSFLGCDNYPDKMNPGLEDSYTAPTAVFQAYLVRVGLKGEVRIDDGTK